MVLSLEFTVANHSLSYTLRVDLPRLLALFALILKHPISGCELRHDRHAQVVEAERR